jgi:ComF family protein
MKTLEKMLYLIREYVFPSGCACCGGALLTGEDAGYGLCSDCRKGLELKDERHCELCGRPLISEIGLCLPCRVDQNDRGLRFCDRVFVSFPYAGKYRQLLTAFKFKKNLGAGHFLAEQAQKALTVLPLNEITNPVWVPVPPRPGKLRKTGWDQVDYLARILEREQGYGGLRVCRCLKRLPSATQKTLNRQERRTNLLGRIKTTGTAPQSAILLDDVITTGSTLDACAAALKSAGTEKVYGVCLFYD